MSVPGPTPGPCIPWVTGEQVLACCSASGVAGGDTSLFDSVAVLASQLMFELSARQFSGLCEAVTVRPCRDTCGCWGGDLSGGVWYWTTSWYGGGGFGWRNECGDTCGCGTASYVDLAGYPVRDIVQVKVDGQVVDPAGYRLEGWRRLLRTTDPGPPPVPRFWPLCQDLGLDDDQPGTWSITYRSGIDPPPAGVQAAAQLACQLYLASTPGNEGQCKLPVGTTKVVKSGITVERGLLATFLQPGQTGLVMVDAFLAAYNPTGMRRRPAVWSPDRPRYPIRQD